MNVIPSPGTLVHEFSLQGKTYSVVYLNIVGNDFVPYRQYRLYYPNGTCRVLLKVTPDALKQMTIDMGQKQAEDLLEKQALGRAMDVLTEHAGPTVKPMLLADLKPILFDTECAPPLLHTDYSETESKLMAMLVEKTKKWVEEEKKKYPTQADKVAALADPQFVTWDSLAGMSTLTPPAQPMPLPKELVKVLKPSEYGPSFVVQAGKAARMQAMMASFNALYGADKMVHFPPHPASPAGKLKFMAHDELTKAFGAVKVTPKVMETLNRFGAVLAG